MGGETELGTPIGDPEAADAPASGRGAGARLPRGESLFAVLAAISSLVAFGLQWLGLQPVVLLAIALVTWFVVLGRRLGPVFAAGLVPIAWLTVVFAVLTVTPGIGLDPRVASNTALVAATIAAVAVVRRSRATMGLRPHVPVILASLAGGFAWLVGMTWGLASPAGGGLSWVMFRDSTMDLWSMRGIIEYRGIGSGVNTFLDQPLNPAFSSSLVSPAVSIEASPPVAQAFLMGHASYWSVLIVIGSFVGGVCVAALVGAGRNGLKVTGALVVSLVLILQPIAGVIAELGQSNAHLVFLVVVASVIATVAGRDHPAGALSVVLAGAALLMASWLPFAIVPLAMTVPLWRRCRALRLTRATVLPQVLAGATVLTWSFINYGFIEVQAAFDALTGRATHLVEATTHAHGSFWLSYTNPYSVPLIASLLAVGGLCVILTLKAARWPSGVAGIAMGALGLGLLPTLLLVSRSAESIGYFPAKQLFITAMCLLPLAVGAALNATALKGVRAVVAVLGLAVVAVIAIAAPTRAGVSRIMPTPFAIATGAHFGADRELAQVLIDSVDSAELRLPWRLSAQHDGTVALMMSSFAPKADAILLQPTRYVLRTFRNDFSANVACQLAVADSRPLLLMTRDPDLSAELEVACPDADIAVDLISVSE